MISFSKKIKISFSTLKKFLEKNTYDLQYFNMDDDDFYEKITEKVPELKGLEAEKKVENECLVGFIDFYDEKNKSFYEVKIRSKTAVDKWFILQCLFYEKLSGFCDWKIVVVDRKNNYEYKIYDKSAIMKMKVYERNIDYFNFLIDDIHENFDSWLNKINEWLESLGENVN